MVFRRAVPILSVCLTIIAGTVILAQQSARKVAKIEVEGLERLSADDVIATSGLKAGAPFSVEDLDAAGQKLMDSGLFAKVSYRTTGRDNQVTVVFQVKENKGGQSPVVFDNFVWFTDDELNAAIKREVPSYTGTASDSGRMTDDIKQALRNLLKEHHIEGAVHYAPEQAGLNSSQQEHLYRVSGVPIPICSLHFPGAANVPEVKLVMSSAQLSHDDYSQKTTVAFSTYVLYPIYRQVGQLKARFGRPTTKLESSTKCKGVELSIPVEEGPIYLWNKAEWVGNEALSASDLADALGMHSGEIANGAKIDKALLEVARTYGHTGHLDAKVNGEPEFDDASKRVSYKITVKEGQQFKMGKLTIKGLEEADATLLSERWKLRNGEVFDTSYSERFFRIDAREQMERIMIAREAQRKGPPEIQITPNRLNLNADVTIEFKP
ncbi:MAG TPA: POTRA domain-containing protein [Pyrinomonadaceae bacterium]|jgi:outer membrane protein insertion porin family|nr:POTRA domain-containing protein [Pyrinomonadaceae bacterium]